jgi:hypothetical protein
MSTINKFLLSAVVAISLAQVPANAITLGFDDLPAYDPVGNGYGDLDWTNFNVLANDDFLADGNGFANAAVSGKNFAYNAFGETAFTSKDSLFTFTGAWFTAAYNNDLQLKVTGNKEGSTLFTQLVVLNPEGPQWFDFNFAGIDELIFNSFGGEDADLNGGGYHFAMDDFTYELFQDPCDSFESDDCEPPCESISNDDCEPPTEVPEPSTLGLVAIGFAGLVLARRKGKVSQ